MVHAFSQDFNSKVLWVGQGTKATWENTTNQTAIGTFAKDTFVESGAGAELVLNTGRSTLAKVVIKTGVTPKEVRRTSDRTKLPYLDYKGKSGSVPFGRANDTDQEIAAFNTIVGRLKGAGTSLSSGMRVSRIKEKF